MNFFHINNLFYLKFLIKMKYFLNLIIKKIMTKRELLKKYPKIYSDKFAEIYDISYDCPNTGFAFWKGFFKTKDPKFIKSVYNCILIMKNYKFKIIISDHHFLKIMTDDVLDFLHKVWYQSVYKNGLIVEICLDAQSIFGQISLDKLSKKLEKSKVENVIVINVKNFEEGKDVAMKILKEKKKYKIS